VNVPATPTRNVVALALVMPGAALTVTVKVWTAFGETPLEAVIVNEWGPPAPAPGVPARVAVPLPLSVKAMPAGRAPLSDRVAVGKPVVVTVNVPAVPTRNVVLLALVMAGASSTVSVKVWTAFGRAPLAAVIV